MEDKPMNIRTPEALATSKQLWLLHVLTKTDTRNLNITMQEASDRIEAAKQKQGQGKQPDKKHTTRKGKTKEVANLKQYQNRVGYGLNIGGIRILEAYRQVAQHETDSIAVSLHATGIFPGGRKPHMIAEYPNARGGITLRPLFEYIQNDVTVTEETFKAWVKSLPVVIKDSGYYPFPESWKAKAIELAQEVDSSIAIIQITES